MIAIVPSAVLVGAEGRPVSVEVHVTRGLPCFSVVGLPDTAVRESRDRVRAALVSSGFTWPQRRITVNLAPSGVRKSGSGLDLPIAVGLLMASEQLNRPGFGAMAFLGELGLDGSVRRVPGVLAMAEVIEQPTIVVPTSTAGEAAAAHDGPVIGVESLGELDTLLRNIPSHRAGAPQADAGALSRSLRTPKTSRPKLRIVAAPERTARTGVPRSGPDLADLRGQPLGRRALEVAAAGRHHLLLIGPPGSGKTMLAERLCGLLPALERNEALEVSRVHSAAGFSLPPSGLIELPPYRAPHHGASAVSLVGGGTSALRPGEISLATYGVLFLDEMGEFAPSVLDALRQPLEEGVVRISRAAGSAVFPAHFVLVGAMNPCPCGQGGPPGTCRCSPVARARYGRRLSGPLLDRFDLVVPIRRPDAGEILHGQASEPSCRVAARVRAARSMAARRGRPANAELTHRDLDAVAPLSPKALQLLERHLRTGELSARGIDRIRRVARTVADLERVSGKGPNASKEPGGSAARAASLIEARHVAEALALRSGWQAFEGTGGTC